MTLVSSGLHPHLKKFSQSEAPNSLGSVLDNIFRALKCLMELTFIRDFSVPDTLDGKSLEKKILSTLAKKES